jgi:hypothetical protein
LKSRLDNAMSAFADGCVQPSGGGRAGAGRGVRDSPSLR